MRITKHRNFIFYLSICIFILAGCSNLKPNAEVISENADKITISANNLDRFTLPIKENEKTLVCSKGYSGGMDGETGYDIEVYDDCSAVIDNNVVSVSEDAVKKLLFWGEEITHDKDINKNGEPEGPDVTYSFINIYDYTDGTYNYFHHYDPVYDGMYMQEIKNILQGIMDDYNNGTISPFIESECFEIQTDNQDGLTYTVIDKNGDKHENEVSCNSVSEDVALYSVPKVETCTYSFCGFVKLTDTKTTLTCPDSDITVKLGCDNTSNLFKCSLICKDKNSRMQINSELSIKTKGITLENLEPLTEGKTELVIELEPNNGLKLHTSSPYYGENSTTIHVIIDHTDGTSFDKNITIDYSGTTLYI